MLIVDQPKDLLQHIGRQLGPSEWITVDQAIINKFADAPYPSPACRRD